jgi:hypothetical protein
VAEVRPSTTVRQVEVLVGGRHRDRRRQPGRPGAPGDLLLVHAGVALTTLPGWGCHEQRAHRLPLPLHRGRGARRLQPGRGPGRLGPGQDGRQPEPCGRHPRALRRPAGAAAAAMADRFGAGGRLFAFGNGGSATDAEGTVELFRRPPAGGPCRPCRWWTTGPCSPPWPTTSASTWSSPARSSPTPRPGDIAVGFSTSGDSVNVLRAFEEASRRGLLTIGFCGYEGGAMAAATPSTTAWSCAPRASTGSRRPRTRWCCSCGRSVQDHLGEGDA